MIKTLCLTVILLVLTACAGRMEIPSNGGTESDVMRKSPCACEELDYDGGGFQWLG